MPRYVTHVIEINDVEAYESSMKLFEASLAKGSPANKLVASSNDHEILRLEKIEQTSQGGSISGDSLWDILEAPNISEF